MAAIRRGLIPCQRAAILLSNANRTSNFPQTGYLVSFLNGNYEHSSFGLPLRFFSTNGDISSWNATSHVLNENKRRILNRLLYRSKQRGFLELDLILGRWVEENIQSLDDTNLNALVEVLDLENPYLWKWLTAQEPAPEPVTKNPVFIALHEKIMKNLNAYASPETRANPGQPWVRGWDDKRSPGGPAAGNH